MVFLGIPDYELFILCVAMLTNLQAGYVQHCAFRSNLIQTRNGSCSRMVTLKYACVHGSNERTCTMDVFRPRISSNGGYYDGNFFQADYKDVFLSVQSFYPPAF